MAADLLRLAERFPVIVTVELAAMLVTGWSWSGHDIGFLLVDFRTWQGEVWRLVGCALPHADIMHLAFNLYWVAVLGSRVEGVLGSLLTALWLTVFAVGSAAAEYALAEGSVGLSGVGYGLFGFLWVLAPRDPRFAGMMDPRTTQAFILWFLLCILSTYAGIWQIANVAHAAGAGFGALAGLVMAPPVRYRRALATATLVAGLAVVLAAASFGRPYVNFTGAAGRELAERAYQALLREDNRAAIELLEVAVRQRNPDSNWWHNLGLAYLREERHRDAARAFRQALALNPTDSDARKTLESLDSLDNNSDRAQTADDTEP